VKKFNTKTSKSKKLSSFTNPWSRDGLVTMSTTTTTTTAANQQQQEEEEEQEQQPQHPNKNNIRASSVDGEYREADDGKAKRKDAADPQPEETHLGATLMKVVSIVVWMLLDIE
jgi:hypothetical protein